MAGLNSSDHRDIQYLSYETYQRLTAFQRDYAEVHGYISVVVCCFGIMANIANIVILNKKHMQTSTNIILLWLAVADLCTMLEYVPFALKFYVFKDRELDFLHSYSYGWIIYLLFHANFSITLHSVSIWLTIMLAIFRFLYIFFPHKGNVYCSMRHAKMVIITVYISAVFVCIPNYISNKWTSVPNETTNKTVYTYTYRNDGGFKVVFDLNYWVQSILIKLVPCFLLTVLTVLLITALHKAHKRHVHLKTQGMRNDDVEKHHEHLRTTAMLLAVVILFLITELPQGIMTLLMIFMDTLYTELYEPIGDFLDIVALLNNAINFVLYCSMSKQFRDSFVNTFCSCFSQMELPRWAKVNLIIAKNGTTGKDVNIQENGTAV